MRVLVLSQYFTPEVGATSTRVHHFAAGLAARGHDVEVICELPNHPQGVIREGWRGRPVRRRRLDGFRGSWVWVRTRPRKGTADRLAFYGSYVALATAYGSLLARPDVVLASSPPLPVGLAGALLARRHRVPLVLDVRDLWPEAAVAVGELSGPRALRLAERLERFLYREAAAITTVTEPFVRHVDSRGGAGKVELVPNGTTRFWLDAARLEPDRAQLGLPADEFVWTFAGNLGLAQGLAAAVDAAALLGPGFRLLLLGDGAQRAALERRAADVAPGRVEFRDQLPEPRAAELLRASDALLVSLAPDPVLASFVPSKLFDFCAAGRPVLLAAAGEPQRLAGEAGAALPVAPGDPAALAAAVRRLRDEPELGARQAAAGRAFAERNLRDRLLERLEAVLEGRGVTAPLRVMVVAVSARTGGGGTHLVNQVAALAREPGIELTVHAGDELARRIRQAAPAARVVGHPRRPLPVRLLVEQVRLARAAREFDVVSAVGNFALLASRVPQVLTVQNAWYFTDAVRRFRRERCPLPMRMRLAVESAAARRSIRHAALVATVSQSMRDAIEQDLGPLARLHVVASAAPSLPAPGALPRGTPDGPYVLVVAHDDPHKEWDRLIAAFAGRPGLPPLVIAGRPRRDRPPAAGVHLLGEVHEPAALVALYAGAACYLAHSRFESFGLTPAEALAAGARVVASDLPAHREVCGASARYYPAASTDAMLAEVAAALAEEASARAAPPARTWADNARELAGLLRVAAQPSSMA